MNHLPITTVFCPWLLLGFYSFFSCMTYGVNATPVAIIFSVTIHANQLQT